MILMVLGINILLLFSLRFDIFKKIDKFNIILIIIFINTLMLVGLISYQNKKYNLNSESFLKERISIFSNNLKELKLHKKDKEKIINYFKTIREEEERKIKQKSGIKNIFSLKGLIKVLLTTVLASYLTDERIKTYFFNNLEYILKLVFKLGGLISITYFLILISLRLSGEVLAEYGRKEINLITNMILSIELYEDKIFKNELLY